MHLSMSVCRQTCSVEQEPGASSSPGPGPVQAFQESRQVMLTLPWKYHLRPGLLVLDVLEPACSEPDGPHSMALTAGGPPYTMAGSCTCGCMHLHGYHPRTPAPHWISSSAEACPGGMTSCCSRSALHAQPRKSHCTGQQALGAACERCSGKLLVSVLQCATCTQLVPRHSIAWHPYGCRYCCIAGAAGKHVMQAPSCHGPGLSCRTVPG